MSFSAKALRPQRAILYTRVSTDEQADRGYSLPAQEAQLRKYCEIQGITAVDHFQDDASAKSFNRPAFHRLLESVKAHRRSIDLLLIVRWDRFSRSIEESYRMLRQLADQGIEVRAVEQPLDLSVPENKMMLAFYLAAPEVENDRRSISTQAGMRRARREGRWIARPPKGYKSVPDALGKPLMVPNEDAALVREAFSEVAKSVYLLEEVRLRLRRKGFRCSKNQFTLLLRNPLYMGKVPIPAWRDEEAEIVEGLHEPLVTEEVFLRVQDVLNGRKGPSAGKTVRQHGSLPLRGHLRCRRCGGNLTGSRTKGNGGTYDYYHCQKGCKERFRAETANECFSELLHSIQVPREVAQLDLAIMQDVFAEKEGDRRQQIERVEAELVEQEKRLLQIDERYVDGDLERDSYLRLKRASEERVRALELRRTELRQTETNSMRYARYGLSLLTDLPRYYEEAALPVKQTLTGLIFPEPLIFERGTYRTPRMNEAVAILSSKHATLQQETEGPATKIGNRSYQAPALGLEPRTP